MVKNNTRETYKEAIVAYYQILEEKKKGKQKLINNLSTIPISKIFLQIIKEKI